MNKNNIFFIYLVIINLVFSLSFAQVTLNSVRIFNGSTGSDDFYSALVSDNAFNIYGAGYCTDGVSSYIILDKFNSSGTKLWSKTYRSYNNGYDVTTSMAMDSSGNIYVAGYTKGLTTSYDFLLIKYSQQGDTLWSRRYNGTANGDDRIIKIGVDRNNSLVVAGNSSETGQGYNIVLIKYDLNGNQIWLKKYDGSGHTDDNINDFVFDKNNFIYIAAANNMNYAIGKFYVMKINPSGDTVWTNVPMPSKSGSARGIITDDSLNVYVTGNQSISQDTSSFYTIKLNSEGIKKWSTVNFEGALHRDFAYRIFLDEQGSVYVAGDLTSLITFNKSSTTDGYAVIKYTNGGQPVWISKVDRNFPSNAICHLIVQNSSNIYLAFVKLFMNENTTKSQCVKYNSNGDSVWVRTLQNQYLFTGFNSFIQDKAGNLLCGSAAYVQYGSDAALIKYNTSGSLMWERYFNSSGFGTDYAVSIGKDSQNNIYVTGTNSKEFIFLKYNSSFIQQWSSTRTDSGTHTESQTFSVFDNSGNTYLTSTKDSLGNKYIILIKYNTSGGFEWQKKYSNNPAIPWGICIDKTGNVIIAGTNWDNNNHSALNLLKYNPSGALIMTTSFNAPYNSSIWIYSVDTDFDNNILVAGSSYGAMTWKFKPNGTLIWEKYWSGTYVHQNNKLIYDIKNNVYVCGYTGTSNGYDYLTIKYDSSGNQKWASTFNGVRSGDDFAIDLVNDTIGNTYVTGYGCNQPTSWDRSVITIKYDSIGNVLWTRDLHFYQGGNLQPAMINRDRFNNIYVFCGYYYYQPMSAGYLFIKYKPNGDSVWTFTYNSPVARNYGKALLLMSDDKIYLTGRAYGNNTGYDITTLELSQTIGIKNIGNGVPEKYALYQNYPNPFNPETKIKFQIPSDVRRQTSDVKLVIYDILGKEISTLVNESLQPGSYEVTFDGSNLPSGIYFYQLRAGDYIETKKLILLK